jgi:hypothetical protein
LLSLLCTGNQSVLLQRHGGAAAGPLPAMQLSVGDVNERVPTTASGGTIPMLRAELPLNSRIGAALASSPQPLMVRLDDAAPLVIPASPLVADYLRGCATARPGQAAPAAPATANTAAPAPAAGNVAAPAANGAQPR